MLKKNVEIKSKCVSYLLWPPDIRVVAQGSNDLGRRQVASRDLLQVVGIGGDAAVEGCDVLFILGSLHPLVQVLDGNLQTHNKELLKTRLN